MNNRMTCVDDLKISHTYPTVSTSNIKTLNNKYGTVILLSISRGRVYDYLGMTFDFSKTGGINITIFDNVDIIIEGSPLVCKSGIECGTTSPSSIYIYSLLGM